MAKHLIGYDCAPQFCKHVHFKGQSWLVGTHGSYGIAHHGTLQQALQKRAYKQCKW